MVPRVRQHPQDRACNHAPGWKSVGASPGWLGDPLRPRVARLSEHREKRMTAFTYDHIHLRSPDAEATARWYENMFGAEIIRSVQSDGRPRLDLNLGGVAVF